MNKVKLSANVLFSGIGCQEQGIKRGGLYDLDVVSTSDIDKYAIISYAALHCGLTNEMIENYTDYPDRETMARELTEKNIAYDFKKNKPFDWQRAAKSKSKEFEKVWLAVKLQNNLGDINKIQELPYADLWTVSFPCQDISVSGLLNGFAEDSKSRSSLVWQQIRLLRKSIEKNEAPKYIMFENVKNLVSKRFRKDFDNLLSVLDALGYNTYWQVLNAKECGIPQNRERVFAICIRKDIDKHQMTFPKPFDNGLRMDSFCDSGVDEKYYIRKELSDKLIGQLAENGELPVSVAQRGRKDTPDSNYEQNIECDNSGIAYSITTAPKDSMVCLRMVRTEEGKRLRKAYENHEIKHHFNEYRTPECRTDGITNTLSTVAKDNLIVEKGDDE